MNKTDFLLAGVGGQGVLTASDIIAEVGLAIGLDAKKSEIHGFSQRGGVVESHVRWGDHVAAPMGEQGRIDYLVAFELLEGARSIAMLKRGGTVIVNRHRIAPMSVTVGDATYPSDAEIDRTLGAVAGRIVYVDATLAANRLGNKNLANVVLLGALARDLGADAQVWMDVMVKCIPGKHVELNKKAFQHGYSGTTGEE